MYKTLTELSIPAIVLNAALNYIVWTHFESGDKIKKVFNRTMGWNLGLAGVIILAGAYYIYHLNTKGTTTTDKGFQFANIVFRALAIGLSGAAVSHWQFKLLDS